MLITAIIAGLVVLLNNKIHFSAALANLIVK